MIIKILYVALYFILRGKLQLNYSLSEYIRKEGLKFQEVRKNNSKLYQRKDIRAKVSEQEPNR